MDLLAWRWWHGSQNRQHLFCCACSDTPLVPPYGPDDGGHPDPDEPSMKMFESYAAYKSAVKLHAASRRHRAASTVAEIIEA